MMGETMITMQKNDPIKAKHFFEDKISFTTGPVEISQKIKEKAYINIVDVRASEDYKKGHVPTAINLPQEKWHDLKLLSKDKVNVIYCYSQTCHIASKAALAFAQHGYSVMEMDGGFKAWQENKLDIEK